MGATFDFVDNVTYGADAINNLRKSIMTRGVILSNTDACKVSLYDGRVFINPGQAMFEDGSVITVDAEGLEMSTELSDFCVFFEIPEENTAIRRANIAANFPQTNYIPLATVKDTTEITDKRIYSVIKPLNTAPEYISFNATFKPDPDTYYTWVKDEATGEYGFILEELELANTNCKYMLPFDENGVRRGCYDIIDGAEFEYDRGYYEINKEQNRSYFTILTVRIICNATKIVLKLVNDNYLEARPYFKLPDWWYGSFKFI